MGQYLPKFKPGQSVTRQASADITGGQMVVVSGNGTVAPSSAASAAWFGVAATDAKNGDDVLIHKGGVQRPVANGAVAAGDLVTTSTAGKVVTAASPAVGTLVGVCIRGAADGGTPEIDFVR